MAGEERVSFGCRVPAEQVGPDFQATETCFAVVRPDAVESGPLGEHRELQRLGHLGGAFRHWA